MTEAIKLRSDRNAQTFSCNQGRLSDGFVGIIVSKSKTEFMGWAYLRHRQKVQKKDRVWKYANHIKTRKKVALYVRTIDCGNGPAWVKWYDWALGWKGFAWDFNPWETSLTSERSDCFFFFSSYIQSFPSHLNSEHWVFWHGFFRCLSDFYSPYSSHSDAGHIFVSKSITYQVFHSRKFSNVVNL